MEKKTPDQILSKYKQFTIALYLHDLKGIEAIKVTDAIKAMREFHDQYDITTTEQEIKKTPINQEIEQEANGLIGCASLAIELGGSVEVIPVNEIKPIIIELLMQRNGLRAMYREALAASAISNKTT